MALILTSQGDFLNPENIARMQLVHEVINIFTTDGKTIVYRYTDETLSRNEFNQIAALAGISMPPAVSLVQWNGGSGYMNLPVNITPGSAFAFQFNGVNLPTSGQYLQVGGGPTWLLTASSSTQFTTGNFAANLAAGTYDAQLFDASNVLLADFGNIITILSS